MAGREKRVDVQVLGSQDAGGLADGIWPCYEAAFGDFDDLETWRRDLFDRHAARSGYRLVVAMNGTTVVGFAWGYTGERGQYWPDLVCEVLPAEITDDWVGGHFEFVELAVWPDYRGHGLGSRLHDTLLAGVSQRCLLSTADDLADPAVRLYLRRGWQKLGVLRPGAQIMGRPVSWSHGSRDGVDLRGELRVWRSRTTPAGCIERTIALALCRELEAA
jgi:ribosomal protein S18 acetylase RimI-like enzyme